MREIINIQVGSCGNKLATSFWANILQEHGLEPDGSYTGNSDLQLKNINTYFSEQKENHYLPRATLIDLEPTAIDGIQAGSLGSLFPSNTSLIGRGGSSSSFARGFYQEGREWVDIALDKIRKQAEQCDSLQGFQMTHSLGGGTGSGMGSLIASKIKEEYPGSLIQDFPVFPSEDVSDIIVEPYNAILALRHLTENADMVQVIHNEALHRICSKPILEMCPVSKDPNQVAAEVMTALTCTLRFPGELNNTMRKMATNLIPFAGLPYLIAGFSEIFQPEDKTDSKHFSPLWVKQRILDRKNCISNAEPLHGEFLSASMVFRGQISLKEVDEKVLQVCNRGSPVLVSWICNNLKGCRCEVPQSTWKLSCIINGNSTAIKGVLSESLQDFNTIFARKTFLYRYTEDGIDEDEFFLAKSSLEDVISEYRDLQDYYPGMEYEEEWEQEI